MGYQKIPNLYKDQDILMFKECYALEKIHGTSAHVTWQPEDDSVEFFSGGEKYDKFVALFDKDVLRTKFKERLVGYPTVFFGEAYGGKMQGMKATYGDQLKFVVFEVKMGNCWLSVPDAEEVAVYCGFEFVDYAKVSTDLSALDEQRDRPSVQAVRNGIEGDKLREGVVLRPLIELRKNNGSRIVAKHKRAEFRERKSIPEVDPAKREIKMRAGEIASEWVVPMRMQHVLDKLGFLKEPLKMEHTGTVIKAMIDDVITEASDEIVDNQPVRKAIGKRAAVMYKKLVQDQLREN
jgi:hypothetical protein